MEDFDFVKTIITDNIKKLKKVKKNINMEFLNCKYINYKEILLNICKILYVNVNSSPIYKENDLLKIKVFNTIKEIKTIIKHLYKLNKIRIGNNDNYDDSEIGDDVDSDVNLINLLIISNSLNYPDLSAIENIPRDFISYNNNELYEYLKNYLEGKYNKFLTSEEIAIFINEKREEYKNKKLKENQNLDIEENEIRRQVKAAGIIKDIYDAGEDGDYDEGKKIDENAKDDDDYKDEEKDDDYNYNDNDNHNIYDDDDIDID
jgi:hypothetical protein